MDAPKILEHLPHKILKALSADGTLRALTDQAVSAVLGSPDNNGSRIISSFSEQAILTYVGLQPPPDVRTSSTFLVDRYVASAVDALLSPEVLGDVDCIVDAVSLPGVVEDRLKRDSLEAMWSWLQQQRDQERESYDALLADLEQSARDRGSSPPNANTNRVEQGKQLPAEKKKIRKRTREDMPTTAPQMLDRTNYSPDDKKKKNRDRVRDVQNLYVVELRALFCTDRMASDDDSNASHYSRIVK